LPPELQQHRQLGREEGQRPQLPRKPAAPLASQNDNYSSLPGKPSMKDDWRQPPSLAKDSESENKLVLPPRPPKSVSKPGVSGDVTNYIDAEYSNAFSARRMEPHEQRLLQDREEGGRPSIPKTLGSLSSQNDGYKSPPNYPATKDFPVSRPPPREVPTQRDSKFQTNSQRMESSRNPGANVIKLFCP
jgi:hypothetical protein